VTISLNVPNDNSSSLFFHFSAPADQTWAGFGLGGQMAGTLMFIVYASNEGGNVTVSPRIATGHVMPQHTEDVQVQVLEGTGIHNGTFVVNAKCTNCRSWDGGSIKTTSTNQAMIWAAGKAGELNDNDLNANIQQHVGYEHFSLDLTKATGTGGVPVVDASTSTIDNSGPTDDDHWGGASGFHAFLMVAAFLIAFPGGYLLLRVFEKVWIHWGVQSAGLILILLGMGVGIAISKRDHIVSPYNRTDLKHSFNPFPQSPSLTSGHQILGFVIILLALATYTLGFIGHRIYKKTKRPAKIMLGHRFLGPATISLGLSNCFWGFRFASNDRASYVFLAATVIMILFVGGVTFMARRQKMRKGAGMTPAAMNFREGQTTQGNMPYGGAGAGPHAAESQLPLYDQGGIPLQSYANTQGPPVYR
jgi:hypothetical protein